jgi:hypothetical protein
MTKLRELLLLFVACSASSFSLADANDIRLLVEQGRYEAAYERGSTHPERIGEPDFDYYFGIAATDSGHAGEGVLALERCLILTPGNLAARAELARAYFVLGEDQRAREEFDTVLKEQPGDAIRRTVERYLDAIAAHEARRRPSASIYLEAGVGTDSNTNGGVSDAAISLPIYGDVLVAPSGVRKSDAFSTFAAGAVLTRPLTREWALFGTVGLDAKINNRYHETDILVTSLGGGISRQMDETSYRVSVAQEGVAVGSDHFRTTNALSGQWQHQFDRMQAIEASAHWARYAYTGANEVRDASYSGIGVGYRRGFVHDWQPVLQLAATYGEEHNDRNRSDLGRDIFGLRIALAVVPAPGWNLTVGINYQDSRYTDADTLLVTRRQDGYYATDVGASYAIDRRLSLRGELLYSENRSNLELYRYRRDVAAVKLRYEFK